MEGRLSPSTPLGAKSGGVWGWRPEAIHNTIHPPILPPPSHVHGHRRFARSIQLADRRDGSKLSLGRRTALGGGPGPDQGGMACGGGRGK